MEICTNEFYKKKVVITGASSGIGSCCANYFLNCGAQVILAARDTQSMEKLCTEFKFSNRLT